MSKAKAPSSKPDEDSATPLLEWVAGVIGALLFAAALGVLIHEAMSPKTPPAIATRMVEIREQPDGWLLVFEAENSGDEPAEAVAFVVSLKGEEDAVAAEREATIDFIGPHSVRRAGVFFASDPRGRDIVIAAQAYLEP